MFGESLSPLGRVAQFADCCLLHVRLSQGMNAILVFVVAQSDISLDTLIQWFYLDQPTDNLYHWYRVNFLQQYFGDDWGIFLWAVS
jgi:hypothetical protein